MEEQKIIKKAKHTIYKHRKFYLERNKTVYQVMKEFAESPDFYIDLKKTIKSINQIKGYKGSREKKEVINYCIKNIDEHWEKLRIKFAGSEGGTDKGKLKLQTYLILKKS